MRVRRMLALCAVLPALAAGCGSGGEAATAPAETNSASGFDLASLPTLEATKRDLRTAMDQIITATKKIAPGVRFRELDVESATTCDPPFDNSAGRAVFLPNRVGDGAAVTDKQWAKIEAAARAAAAKIGATGFEAVKAGPGVRDVWFLGPARMSIKLAYQKNMVISGYTGCRLAGEKEPAGR